MKTSIDETELDRLEALAGKTTPLPWVETTDPSHFYTISTVLGGGKNKIRGLSNQLIVQVGGWANTQEQEANTCYIAAACNAVPALVAEVRRLREDVCALRDSFACEHEALMRHEHMVAELMEKVEAWEWFGECFDNCKQRGKLPLEVHKTPSAYSEAWASLWAAREAVHADRE